MEQNENSRFTCPIFYFLLAYAKLAFYLCMLPFKAIIDEDGKVEFKQYRLHRVLCLALHLSSLYFGVTVLWNLTIESSEYPNYHNCTASVVTITTSAKMYQLALFALLNSAVVAFIVNCWFVKPNPYKILLTHTFGHIDNQSSYKYYRVGMLAVLFMAFIQIALTANIEIANLLATLNFHQRTTISLLAYLVTVFQAVYFQLLFQITVILPFDLSTFCMFLIGRSFKELASIEYAILASPNTKWHQQSLERLTDYYLAAQSLTKVLNKSFGTNMIIIFLSSLPTLGFGLSCLLSNAPVPMAEHIRTIYILCAFYFFLMLAAKGQHNVQNFTQSAFEQMWKNGALKNSENDSNTRSLLLTVMQYVNSSCVGVGGTPFYICTYRFVGTMTSALMTYTIIMIQFRE